MADVTIGGRRFEAMVKQEEFDRRTVAQDHYLMRLMRASGADRVIPMDGDDDDAYLMRLQVCLIDSGKMPDIVGGCLTPEGGEWSPEIARETAKHVASCNTQDDRAAVVTLCIAVVINFFRQGVESWNRLRSYGTEAGSEAAPQIDRLH